MKNIGYSLVALIALGTFAVAGGDVTPVEPVVEAETVDESGFYAGVAYSYMQFGFDEEYNTWDYASGNAYTLLAGYGFNKYIAVEGRYSATVGDLTATYRDSLDLSDRDFDGEITNLAIYLKPMYPVGGVTLYGLLGYGTLKYAQEGTEIEDSSFQWGVGASVDVFDSVDVFVDYVSLYDDKGFDSCCPEEDMGAYSINVGVTYKF